MLLLQQSRRTLFSACQPALTRRSYSLGHPLKSKRVKSRQQDQYLVVAIETSCDDTSVAIVNVKDASSDEHSRVGLDVLFHEKVTANNDAHSGIHPILALESHRATLAPLLKRAFKHAQQQRALRCQCYSDTTPCSECSAFTPEFVAVTRGPGMRSNLSVGLDTAKGLAAVWDVPLIGVHHMQAHALTPRLVTAKRNFGPWDPQKPQQTLACYKYDHECSRSAHLEDLEPAWPFLTVLASGGHTMLLNSASLTEHTILAESQDIAIGVFLDKAARAILPPELLRQPFGRALEQFAFSKEVRRMGEGLEDVEIDADLRSVPGKEYLQSRECSYDYTPPARRQDELESRQTGWGWALTPPLSESKSGSGEKLSSRMVYSFAGLLSSVERLMKREEPISLLERQVLAREVQRVAFEHLASRILLHLSSTTDWQGDTIVVSGGVASNHFLRHLLRRILDVRGHGHIKLSFPPVELCTDNALMIAWAAIEMYEAGYTSSLDIGPLRKWSMDPKAPDGGILGVSGWIKTEAKPAEDEQ
ncbi:hypothetical protein LTR08_003823 [Meristemomyces frigidus]|nr:hypothetical protein LTR08_003823 [Meristemomyces frigidus]